MKTKEEEEEAQAEHNAIHKAERAEQIKAINIGYGLDGGGHTFTEPPKALEGLGAFVWDDPDNDYFPCRSDNNPRLEELSCPVLAFAPQDGHFERTIWPTEYVDDSGHTMVLQWDGIVYGTDRECDCVLDNEEYPDTDGCTRCSGDKYIDSPGGEFAIYARKAEEDEE